MRIALTGATGFIGRYIAENLAGQGHQLRCLCRPTSDRSGLEHLADSLQCVTGDLDDGASCQALVEGCEAVVHAALFHPGGRFRGGEGNIVEFVDKNVLGTIRLIEAAQSVGADRFVLISTCAVHEKILDDRPLDENHPTLPTSHYGAHKAALEQFVHSYGFGHGYPICALRPTGVCGVTRPVQNSKWFDLVSAVVRGQPVTCQRGGKEVHAADVAKAVRILLTADGIAGQAYNCCDRYVSEFEVATIARRIAGSSSQILGEPTAARHEIVTDKIRALGMEFGGRPLLEATIAELVAAARG